MFEKKEEKKTKMKLKFNDKITPKKDWLISHNEYQIVLKEGVSCVVPVMFHAGLKTENVIASVIVNSVFILFVILY